jgi:IclR family transcriptional regulator, acetate operon repressor
LPLHCCAFGKMYLSTLPIDQAMGIFDRIFKKTSARNTIVCGAMFERALLEIRETGFAFDDQEWFDDMIGASVPIFNRE